MNKTTQHVAIIAGTLSRPGACQGQTDGGPGPCKKYRPTPVEWSAGNRSHARAKTQIKISPVKKASLCAPIDQQTVSVSHYFIVVTTVGVFQAEVIPGQVVGLYSVFYFFLTLIIFLMRPHIRYMLTQWSYRIWPTIGMILYFGYHIQQNGANIFFTEHKSYLFSIWQYAIIFIL